MSDRQIGYHFANGDTICNECITEKEKQRPEIVIYLSEYLPDRLPICDRCQCTMTGEE